MGHVHRDYSVAVQRHHHTETSGGDQIHSGHAKARCQNAIEGRGRAATLNVSQDDDPYVFAGAAGNGVAQQIADRTGAAVLFQLRRRLHAFGDHHNREILAHLFAFRNVTANVFDGERNLRDQDDMSPAGNARLECDPAAVASHHLYHHHAMGRGRSGMNLDESIGGGLQRGIKSKGDLGGRKIIVDCLGSSYDLHSLLEKLIGDFLRSVAADADDGVDPQLSGIGNYLCGNVALHFPPALDLLVGKWIATVGGAENRAAARQNAADFLERELERFFRPDQPVEAIGNADNLPPIFKDGSFGGGANDGVKAGRISASGGDTDTANFRHKVAVGRPDVSE